MKKALLTATVQSHIVQFHLPLIDLLKANGYEVHVAARNNLEEKNGLKLDSPTIVYDIPFDRTPLSRNNIRAFNQLKKIIAQNQYDIVHCNTPMGGVVTRLATKDTRKKGTKVFYTAHGFHFYKGAPLKNWMIYYPIEKWLTSYTDKLITISNEDYKLAINRNFKTKVEHIHGVGANTEKYYPTTSEFVTKQRLKHGYLPDDFICICTGELNRNKNQSTIIKAVPQIIKIIPEFKLLLAGNGPLRQELEKLIDENQLSNHVKLIGYRTDLESYVKISDIALSASIREGLGLNLIEAMLCGKPIIGSHNRGHKELISHLENGLLVGATSSREFAEAVIELYTNKKLHNKMQKNSLEISQKYTKENVTKELKRIYEL